MALNYNERALIEAVDSMLQSKAKLGLPPEDPEDGGYNDPRLRGLEYLHGQIDEMFALRAADLTHHTGVCAAFSRIHGYKYLDDPGFGEAMDREMIAQGIPSNERRDAIGFIPKIINELRTERDGWSEQDFGFHPELNEVMQSGFPKDDD